VVRGLDVFREYFAGHADQFVLIGGTAATLAMEEAGLEFRATKDLDIVLYIEALSPSFGEVFWSFVEAGGYEIRQSSDTGKPVFYRFQKPADERFPVMLELFCRAARRHRGWQGRHRGGQQDRSPDTLADRLLPHDRGVRTPRLLTSDRYLRGVLLLCHDTRSTPL